MKNENTPRTQGREPEYDPREDPCTNWVLDYAIELENIQRSRNHMLEDERGNRSPVLTRGTIIDTIWKYFAAQPQPAPRPVCPKCGSSPCLMRINATEEDHLSLVRCYKCGTDFELNEVSDFAQFFAAIPAQKEKE